MYEISVRGVSGVCMSVLLLQWHGFAENIPFYFIPEVSM